MTGSLAARQHSLPSWQSPRTGPVMPVSAGPRRRRPVHAAASCTSPPGPAPAAAWKFCLRGRSALRQPSVAGSRVAGWSRGADSWPPARTSAPHPRWLPRAQLAGLARDDPVLDLPVGHVGINAHSGCSRRRDDKEAVIQSGCPKLACCDLNWELPHRAVSGFHLSRASATTPPAPGPRYRPWNFRPSCVPALCPAGLPSCPGPCSPHPGAQRRAAPGSGGSHHGHHSRILTRLCLAPTALLRCWRYRFAAGVPANCSQSTGGLVRRRRGTSRARRGPWTAPLRPPRPYPAPVRPARPGPCQD